MFTLFTPGINIPGMVSTAAVIGSVTVIVVKVGVISINRSINIIMIDNVVTCYRRYHFHFVYQ